MTAANLTRRTTGALMRDQQLIPPGRDITFRPGEEEHVAELELAGLLGPAGATLDSAQLRPNSTPDLIKKHIQRGTGQETERTVNARIMNIGHPFAGAIVEGQPTAPATGGFVELQQAAVLHSETGPEQIVPTAAPPKAATSAKAPAAPKAGAKAEAPKQGDLKAATDEEAAELADAIAGRD